MTENSLSQLQVFIDDCDRARLGAFHIKMVSVTGICVLWTSLGVSITSFLLPSLKAEWSLSTSQQGWVASMAVMGMMLGAVLAGSLSDRIGRRNTLALIMVWLGIFSALSAFSNSYVLMLFLRLLTGLGLGAVLPVTSTLVGEYSPARFRGGLLVLLNGFWGLGGALAALAGYLLVGRFGWRPTLLFTSLCILSAPFVRWSLPESLRFLLNQGRIDEAVQYIARIHIVPDPRAAQRSRSLKLEAPLLKKANPSGLKSREFPWTQPYTGRTVSLWLLWFAFNFTFQGVFVWLPSILIASGDSVSRSYLFTLVISLGQVPGTILAALLADRASRRLVFGISIVFWSVSVFLFGFSAGPASVLIWGFLLAVGNGATWGLAYPFTTELYPTRMRGAATGWATGFGRIGGIIAPLIVGALIQGGAGNAVIFSLLASVPLLSSLLLVGQRQLTTGQTLEEIST